MLSNTLITNEIKNSAGTEVEFERLSINGRSTEFKALLEVPGRPLRLKISHQEIGTDAAQRRRSLIRFDEVVTNTAVTQEANLSCQLVMDIPIGILDDAAPIKRVLAYMMSFCASLGASTTILYDGTGNGAVVMANGSL